MNTTYTRLDVRRIRKIFLVMIIMGAAAASANAQKNTFPTLDFGDVEIGTTRTLTDGLCTLVCDACVPSATITGFTITGADASEFTTDFASLIGRELPQGQCVSFHVSVTPIRAGFHRAVLDISSTHAGGGVLIPLQAGCPVSPLSPITDSAAQNFEAGNTVDTTRLQPALQTALSCFQSAVTAAGGNTSSFVSSAFRPTAYQNHLREIYDKWLELKNKSLAGCSSLKTQVQAEFNKHGLGHLKIRPASPTGPHTTGDAFDVNIGSTGLSINRLDELATGCNLRRPHPATDAVHFQLQSGNQSLFADSFANSSNPLLDATQDPVHIRVYQQTLGGRVFYRYRVINNSGRNVVGLLAGIDLNGNASELTVAPVGWNYFTGLPLNSVEAPAGWDASVVTTEESDFLTVAWEINQAAAAIASGVTQTGFSIMVPVAQDPFKLGHWAVILDDATTVPATLEVETAPSTNPIDSAQTFVMQHYDDLLNRAPDSSGLAFWTNEISSCGSNAACIEVKRINVSAAFFLSIEFQNTGYLVYRFYKTAYGDGISPGVAGTVPIIRLEEFLPDTQQIGQGVVVNVGDWQARLEANKTAFAREFVQRSRFTDAYPAGMSPAAFVDKLSQMAGGVLSATERTQLINELTANNTIPGRASVLRKVAEDDDLSRNEFNRAFVLMQYFGYLRRNPDNLPDNSFNGWKFWLDKLNQFNGNFVNAEMVKAFITSAEYRQRFGQ